MKRTFYTILLIFNIATAFAQAPAIKGSIKGIIIDSAKNAPLPYATVTITDGDTKQAVKSNLSKDNGSFEFNNLSPKNYTFTVASVGYKPKTIVGINIKSAKEGIVDLGKIMLSTSTGELNEVKVTAAKPLVKQEIDRVSYDVQADPESKVQTAMDMLRKLPLVSVDGDDNIQLQGSASYKIFINGKPSALMASNPKDVLRSMPANTIVKIEVITTPPAKYDSEGLAGIINIITTKKTDDGYNGTLTSRYNSIWGPNENITGTFKKGKFGISGYAGLGRQNMNTTINNNLRQTFSPATTLAENGDNTWGGNFVYSSLDLSYEADSLNLLTSSLSLDRGDFNQDNNRNSLFMDATGITQQSYHIFNNGDFNWRGTDASLNYQRGFEHKAGRLLTLSYKYSYSSNLQNNDVEALERFNYTLSNYKQYNNSGSKEHTFQLDYVHPLKKLNIEAGGKAILRNNFSDFETQNADATGLFIPDPTRTNDFNYHQDIYAAYNSYQLKLTKWTFKGGLRLEHTTVDADFTANNISLNTGYTNLVPSLSIMRSLKNNMSLTFGFTNRIERPGIYQLNPFLDRTNPRALSIGNPNLTPVLMHSFELNFTKSGKGSLSARLSYNYVNNGIQSVTTLLSDTVTLASYENAGKRYNSALNLSFNYPITPKLNFSINNTTGYIVIKGTYNGQFYRNQGVRANGNTSLTYKVNDAWRFGLSGGYSSPYLQLQGRSSSYIYSSLSGNYTFWNKKATLSANANNPFQQYRYYKNFTNTPDFDQINTYRNLYRTFSVSFAYKFGKLSSDIKKNQRSISNDDVNSSGGKSN